MQGSCRGSKTKIINLEIIKLYRLASSSWRDRCVNVYVVMTGQTFMYVPGLKLYVFYRQGEDPAAGTGPEPNVV